MPLHGLYKALTDDMTPQVRRAVLRTVLWLFFICFVIWASGGVPKFPGFALASELEEVERKVKGDQQELKDAISELAGGLEKVSKRLDTIEVLFLEERIERTQRLRCDTENPRLKRQFSDRLQRLMTQYTRATHSTFPLQGC